MLQSSALFKRVTIRLYRLLIYPRRSLLVRLPNFH